MTAPRLSAYAAAAAAAAAPCGPAELADDIDAPEPGNAAAQRQAARAIELIEALRRLRKEGKVTELPAAVERAQQSLERRIRAHLGQGLGTVKVTLTDNRYTMISVRRVATAPRVKRYEVRLHHMFADADPVITRALSRYVISNDRDASRVLGDFIDANSTYLKDISTRAQRSPTQVLVTAGDHHDLREIYDHLNELYFGNSIDALVTWGPRMGKPKRRNSIKMGSYVVEDRLIRIHRSLDRVLIPRFFVEWVMFHEMLHQVHHIPVKNGRREYHGKAFLADEAKFLHYRASRMFERTHLEALLTC